MPKPVIKESEMSGVAIVDSLKQWTLNFTDIGANSNKSYCIEKVKCSDGKFYLYSVWGRTGGSMTREFRACSDEFDADNEVRKIIKSKEKKGYQQIYLIKTNYGSDIAKSKVSASVLSEDGAKKAGYTIKEENKSSLHPAVQAVVKQWFGSIEQFIVDTLDTSKCALGQLSIDQINKGRDLLLEARKLVASGGKDISELNSVSSKYYSNIPMNFGYRRLDADVLRFDTDTKLDTAFDILETLEGAKDVEKILTKKNAIDEQYKSLKTEMDWVDPKSEQYKWVDMMFHKTRAPNHHFLGKIKIKNVFKLARNIEYEKYMANLEKLSGQDHKRGELPSLIKPIWGNRIAESKEYEALYDKVNVLPLFHGTRTPNMPKILASRLMKPKQGFTISGAMYGIGVYYGFSSKAINYSSASGSYWGGGSDRTGFMFLSDVALGKQKIATGAHSYSLDKIRPCISVWAKGGSGSGVINDEFIIFDDNGQNLLRYVIEFETGAK